MKKIIILLLSFLSLTGYAQKPTDTPASQMEKLDRGLVVVRYPSGRGVKYFASWRLLGTDDKNTTFALLKNGEVLQDNISRATSVGDISATASDRFQVVTYQNGNVIDTTPEAAPWTNYYLQVPLDCPANGKTKPYTTTINKETVSYPNGQDYSYTPNDCSVGDVDGDGQYELLVKWDPTNSKDNSQNGVTGIVYIDCYKLDGTKLWRIDLGQNIRAGAHYTQFMVYDFDGDGKAELMCKTAPGSKDALGNYVNQAATDEKIKAADNTKDWVSEGAGRINGGQEYLTVFNGLTGAAVHTIAYYPNRNAKAELSEAAGTFNWDDRSGKSDKGDYGNRGERYLAAVAYLGGPDANPSGVFCRGYYTYAYLWAVDFDGQQLKTRWLHSSDKKTSYRLMDANGDEQTFEGTVCSSGLGRNTMYANGNHNLSVADVDGDGCDEILWGSAALDNDGKMLYAVGFGHGDAIHLADIDPDRPGYELMDIHEEPYEDKDNKIGYGYDIHDARTGEVICSAKSDRDTGRGIAADFDQRYRGCEFTYATQTSSFKINGAQFSSNNPGMNFRIFWDGDEYEELLNDIDISKWKDETTTALGLGFHRGGIATFGSPASCNGTKATPCLQADLFGDWREELIFWDKTDAASLIVYSSAYTTAYRVPTLMHDHVYRMGIAWQNVAYNQPPHLGYYLPDYIESFRGIEPTGIQNIETDKAKTDGKFYNLMGMPVEQPAKGVYIKNGKKLIVR